MSIVVQTPKKKKKVANSFKLKPVNEKFYLKNPRLKAVGVKYQFTQEQVNEWVRCSQDPVYFIKKYCKIIHVDRGMIDFEMFQYQEEIIDIYKSERKVIVRLPRQMGKALDIETPILTPDGFVKLKDIRVNDFIYGPDGKQTQVTFITDVMHDHPCYDVTFSNGDTLKADQDHLWTVHSADWSSPKTLTTKELLPYLSHTNKPFIPFTSPIQFPHKELPIDPYTLGVWIGDGNSNDARITCHKNDLLEYSQYIHFNTHVGVDKRNHNVVRPCINELYSKLRECNLLGNKHIPITYLHSSTEQRLRLIQGMMDTDGSVTNKNGSCQFYQKRKHIAHSFRMILSSLGVKSTITERVVNGEVYNIVTFMPNFTVFRLTRKKEKQKVASHKKNTRLYIRSVTPTASVPVRCLQVDNDTHLFLAGETLIPTHNTTTTAGFFLWYVLFHDNKVCAIMANKAPTAQEILARVKLMYENLPLWIQQGIIEWNKRSITLENGSRILAAATSSSAIRGYSLSLVFLDEFAHVPNNIAEEFFTSIYPTISSGKETKILIASTPNGMNHYYKFWTEAESKTNDFIPVFYQWNRMPGRDEEWLKEQERALGPMKFRQEVLCEFMGSSDTLIAGAALATMAMKQPISEEEGWKVYEHPQDGHTYIISVDPSRGLDRDASAFWVVDISVMPYRGVAVYHSHTISPIILPNIIYNAANRYNKAFVLVEINDNGQQVVDMLHHDLEYENVFKLDTSTKQGAKVSGGFKKSIRIGLRMTESVKRIGCQNLKLLIEDKKLLIHDFDTISEFSTFTQQNQTFKADEGFHDDLVMCLVMFSWLMTQKYIRDLQPGKLDLRKILEQEQNQMVEDDLVPAGFIDTGLDNGIFVEDGDLWVPAKGSRREDLDQILQEYAERGYSF